jgi:FKBP-type peptidyl-prolyl cis-trans isomerase
MGLFAEIISNDELELDIPEGHSLTLTNAVLEPLKKGKKDDDSVLLYVQTSNEDNSILLGRYSNSNNGPYQSIINVKFGPEDGTIKLWTPSESGKIHVTGIWSWEEHDHDDDDEDCTDVEEEGEDLTDETAEEMYCQEIEPVEQVKSNKKDKKVNKVDELNNIESSSNSKKRERLEEVKKKKEKKRKDKDEIISSQSPLLPANAASIKRTKTWKISPSNDEGIKVPVPKAIKKDGIQYTDYIIGKGKLPKLGAFISITYEGSFPEGEIFDSKLKTTSPFKFRKGTGMVVKGLDIGLDDMRIGGSREIIIPGKLG